MWNEVPPARMTQDDSGTALEADDDEEDIEESHP